MTRAVCGDLEPAERDRILDHAKGCETCGAFVLGLFDRQARFLAEHPSDQVLPEVMREAKRRAEWFRRLLDWIRR